MPTLTVHLGPLVEMSLKLDVKPQPIGFTGLGVTKYESILKANLQFLHYVKALCARKKETSFV